MPRRPRLIIENQPHHVVQRGHNRKAVFFAKEDYLFYRECAGLAAARHGCLVHAYCLMTNHIHLLVTPPSPLALSRMMQMLGRLYVRHVNRLMKRSGTLWEDRFKVSLVDAENYFLACMRYIELNPVRARMVAEPQDYPWSSYHANGMASRNDGLVTPHTLYASLGGTEAERAAAYRDFAGQAWRPGDLELIRQSIQGSWALGGVEFCDGVERKTGQDAAPSPRGGDRRSTGFKNESKGPEQIALPGFSVYSGPF